MNPVANNAPWNFLDTPDHSAWAIRRGETAYTKVMIDPIRKELSITMNSNDHPLMVIAGAPIDVVADLMRKAGWTVMSPEATEKAKTTNEVDGS